MRTLIKEITHKNLKIKVYYYVRGGLPYGYYADIFLGKEHIRITLAKLRNMLHVENVLRSMFEI